MSTVQRSVYINPIEPAPLSLWAPMGMETRVEVTFYSQNGSPYTVDVAGQLQLTARSSDRTSFYAMPATDLANGKARAVIPAGALTDINGYRLRLTGTVDQQPMLIAMGVLTPIAAAGPEAVPQDVIDSIQLTLDRGYDAVIQVEIWHDAAKSNPYDLGGATITATITGTKGGPTLAAFSVAESGNDAVLTMLAAVVNGLPNACWWTLAASTTAGTTTLAEGPVTVRGTVP